MSHFNPALFFPEGAFARLMQTPQAASVRESMLAAGEPNERQLQCVWFDPAFRPPVLRTHTGEEVLVDNPGNWNLEAGPDFIQAALKIGPDRRRLVCDVEIHRHAVDWVRHGHQTDPRFAEVKAHVTYHPACLPAEQLPPGAIQISLKENLANRSSFSFDSVDTTAYPYAARAGSGLCNRQMLSWRPEQRATFLEAAGAERLAHKAERMAEMIAAKGAGQALYEEIFAALGYKHNRAPFRALAARMPVDVLREESALMPLRAYALLSGMAGLLPPQMDVRWNMETKTWVRKIWDAWWTASARWAPRALSRDDWRLSGLRPPNRPERRLMAAACFFTQAAPFHEQAALLQAGHKNFWENALALLENSTAQESFWNRHWSVGGPKTAAPVALVGKRRAAAMLANVLLPFLAAVGKREIFTPELLRRLPGEEDNSLIRQAAHNLFGPDHNPSLYGSGLRQQGLLHIFHSYCLNDRSACRNCGLPDMLQGINKNFAFENASQNTA